MDTNLNNLQADTTPEAPRKTFQPPSDLSNLNPNSWGGEVQPSKLATQMAFENVRQLPGVMNEGNKAGSDAANALFAQNTSGISSALASRAKRTFSRGQQRQELDNKLKGFQRSSMAIGQSMAEQNQLWKLKRANFAGQLQWADKVSQYNQAMETTKLGLLSSIISGGMSIAGFALGGPAGGAAGAAAGKALS